MNKVSVIHLLDESNYPISTSKLEKGVKDILQKRQVEGVSLVIVLTGEEKMKSLASEYLGEKNQKAHNVLSFPARETKIKFIFPPEKFKVLGEVIVCYPKALEEAEAEGKEAEEKVIELAQHGTLHLLGIHHK